MSQNIGSKDNNFFEEEGKREYQATISYPCLLFGVEMVSSGRASSTSPEPYLVVINGAVEIQFKPDVSHIYQSGEKVLPRKGPATKTFAE